MTEKLIFHIDVNSAFLSWSSVDSVLNGGADYRTIPAIVGGDREKRHGVVLAKSGPAKKYGIKTGEPIVTALKKCPGLIIIPPHFELYEHMSRKFIEALERYAPVVDQVSIDEAFADMTGTAKLYGTPLHAAGLIKDMIKDELHFTVNIGISVNHLLAKMASDFEKPDKIHTLFPNEIEKKMWPLPVGELFFVGATAEKKLSGLGIHTIGDLAKSDVSLLRAHMKKQGEIIHGYANGNDLSHIFSRDVKNKGYGNSTTIPFDVTDRDTALNILLSLCETVATRLRIDHIRASLITVQITDCHFVNSSHQCILPVTTNVTNEIFDAVQTLFDELWDKKTPIRLLGVSAGRLTNEQYRQYNLFDKQKYEKLSKVDSAIDKIRNKYGEDAVKRASFLNNRTYNMIGGISKDKRLGNKADDNTSP